MAGAGVRTPVHHSGQRSRALVQAARGNLHRQFSRDGSAARSSGELPRAAGLGANRWHPRNLFARRVDQGIFAATSNSITRRLRYGEVVLVEPALHQAKSARAHREARRAVLCGRRIAAGKSRSPALWEMENLYWLNRNNIKKSPPERIEKLAEPFFVGAGLLPESPDERTRDWFSKVVALLKPSVDKLDQL